MFDLAVSLCQVQLNSKLLNTDLIEYIAYKHDNEDQTTTLPRALADQPDHEDSELSSPIGSDSDEDVNFNAMRRVGPVAAVTDLGADQAELQRTVWFVDLEEEDIAAITPLVSWLLLNFVFNSVLRSIVKNWF